MNVQPKLFNIQRNIYVLESKYIDFMENFNCHIGIILFGEWTNFCCDYEFIITDLNMLGRDSVPASPTNRAYSISPPWFLKKIK